MQKFIVLKVDDLKKTQVGDIFSNNTPMTTSWERAEDGWQLFGSEKMIPDEKLLEGDPMDVFATGVVTRGQDQETIQLHTSGFEPKEVFNQSDLETDQISDLLSPSKYLDWRESFEGVVDGWKFGLDQAIDDKEVLQAIGVWINRGGKHQPLAYIWRQKRS